MGKEKSKLLLHICCAGCGVYISEVLKDDFDIILYFYNPNVFPEKEYLLRFEETKKISQKNCPEGRHRGALPLN